MEPEEYNNLRTVEDEHWWFLGLHELVLALLRPRLTGDSPTILDSGCGTGGLLSRLKELGDAEGFDSSELGLAHCRDRGLEVRRVDLNTDELPTARYDAVTSIDVLYHRGIRDVPAALRKLHDALKPGGVLVLHLPAYELLRSRHDDNVHTAHRFTLSETRDLLRHTGFEIERASYRVTLLFPAVLLARIASAMGRAIPGRSEEQQSDVTRISPWLNKLLLGTSRLENRLLRVVRLPFGVSLFVVARRP